MSLPLSLLACTLLLITIPPTVALARAGAGRIPYCSRLGARRRTATADAHRQTHHREGSQDKAERERELSRSRRIAYPAELLPILGRRCSRPSYCTSSPATSPRSTATPPRHTSTCIAQALRNRFGEVFSTFDETPLGAASIGQVRRIGYSSDGSSYSGYRAEKLQ